MIDHWALARLRPLDRLHVCVNAMSGFSHSGLWRGFVQLLPLLAVGLKFEAFGIRCIFAIIHRDVRHRREPSAVSDRRGKGGRDRESRREREIQNSHDSRELADDEALFRIPEP